MTHPRSQAPDETSAFKKVVLVPVDIDDSARQIRIDRALDLLIDDAMAEEYEKRKRRRGPVRPRS